ncbi:MAG: hypothetical protein JO358_21265 [Alphaproteobacteria bacterium]|nr:hypothetical protein [Alphaproteobacteria bacterium]
MCLRWGACDSGLPSPNSRIGSGHDDNNDAGRRECIITISLSRVHDVWPIALAFCVGTTATPARAEYPAAPDVVVFCEPTLRHAIADVAGLCNRLVMAASTSAGSVNLAEVAGKAPVAIVDPPVGVAGIEGDKALQSVGL